MLPKLEPFTGALDSPEHAAWREHASKLNARAGRKFVKRMRAMGIVGYEKPAPGEIDWEDEDEG